MLKYTPLSRSRLWVEARVGRLFVPTTSAHHVGERVSVEVEAADLEGRLELTGDVVEVRPLAARSPAGVVLALDAGSIDRCRTACGADQRLNGESRVECEFDVRLLQPLVMQGRARNLSVGGMTLNISAQLTRGAPVGLSLVLPDGEVLLSGEVAWVRSELQLCGVQFKDVAPEVSARLATQVSQLSSRAAPPSTVTTAPTAGPMRTILVADDDPSILDFSTVVITRAGYRAVRADRGDDALELARREKPALLMLDVLMPGLDGLEVCQAVRADPVLKDTPVVLLSAMGEQRLSEAAARVGATAWLTKPMRLDALRALFTRLIPASALAR